MRLSLIHQLLALLWLAALLGGCAARPAHVQPEYDWEARLQGNRIVLLGEIHDNAEHHRLRLNILRRAVSAGWRPAIAMEQFDRERQSDIERARREQPQDAQHVINIAGLSPADANSSWHWDYYRPFVALALEYDLPLIAANLSRADTRRIVRGGYSAVFDEPTIQSLGLALPIPADLQAAQEHAMDNGHCNALPPKMVPAMTRGQFARDAVMAAIVSKHAATGLVLLAGNSHIKRDMGAPRWLSAALLARTTAVGFLEQESAASKASFDTAVKTATADRPDPCTAFRKSQQLNR